MKKIALALCFVTLLIGCLVFATGCNEQSWQDLARKQGYDVELVEVNKDEFVSDETLKEALVSVTKVTFRVDEDADAAAEAFVFEFKTAEDAAKYYEESQKAKPGDEIIGAGSVTINDVTAINGVYTLRGFGPLVASLDVECISKATK